MRKTIFTLFSLLTAYLSVAQDSTKSDKFVFSGYIDSYYLANFNSPANQRTFGASGFARAFDYQAGSFSLGLVQAKGVYTHKNSEVVVDLTFGPHGDLGNYGNKTGLLGTGIGSTGLAIKQAYFNWKASDKFTLTAGQFGTHIGYEVIDAPINYHYSLSNLFTNGPFYHLGVKGTYAFSDKASLMFGVVNGIDNIYETNRGKGIIGQLFVSPASGWNVYLNYMYSDEAATGAVDSTYSILDLTTSYQISPKFLLGVNAALGSQSYGKPSKSDSWGGIAGYATYNISDSFSLGARYEMFDNKSGIRALKAADGTGTTVNSLTLTGSITVADGHLIMKPELRVDSYDKNQFMDDKGAFSKKSQTTLTYAFIYKF